MSGLQEFVFGNTNVCHEQMAQLLWYNCYDLFSGLVTTYLILKNAGRHKKVLFKARFIDDSDESLASRKHFVTYSSQKTRQQAAKHLLLAASIVLLVSGPFSIKQTVFDNTF
jgi:hypothetical protein